MNYSVLARKWRPKSLKEMVGQEHILTIISNSIQKNRLHHAYLFCGTRGVGKTTLARIFTKCLNCEQEPSSNPCNQCQSCLQIDAGTYPDLIEIDAASRTKVEDTRELLDNVQYAPTQGRYKVYLIDEVHMLSGHSFNALLKTLEEPPSHVKFLLATTDPQKLPITVLSRCLKLTLKMLTIPQITAHLEFILKQENIKFESAALTEIAQAAQGSMRDALSLLDQAIVYSEDTLLFDQVCQLLGTETKYLNRDLLEALIDKNEEKVFSLIEKIEEKNGDFLKVADDLLSLLHHLALYQKNKNLLSLDYANLNESLSKLSQKIHAQDIQLLYQIILMGKRDLAFAPSMRFGFDIIILRAMDFYPLLEEKIDRCKEESKINPPKEKTEKVFSPSDWPKIIAQLSLKGISLTIANQASIGKISDNRLQLILSERHQALCNEKQKIILSDALTQYIGKSVCVDFCFIETEEKQTKDITTPLENIKEEVMKKEGEDPTLTQLLNMFDADIENTTIKKGK